MEAITDLLVAGIAGGVVFAIAFGAFRRHHDGVPGSIPTSGGTICDMNAAVVSRIGTWASGVFRNYSGTPPSPQHSSI